VTLSQIITNRAWNVAAQICQKCEKSLMGTFDMCNWHTCAYVQHTYNWHMCNIHTTDIHDITLLIFLKIKISHQVCSYLLWPLKPLPVRFLGRIDAGALNESENPTLTWDHLIHFSEWSCWMVIIITKQRNIIYSCNFNPVLPTSLSNLTNFQQSHITVIIIIIIVWFGDTVTVSHLTKCKPNSKVRAMSWCKHGSHLTA
jgi:hypothetical protein